MFLTKIDCNNNIIILSDIQDIEIFDNYKYHLIFNEKRIKLRKFRIKQLTKIYNKWMKDVAFFGLTPQMTIELGEHLLYNLNKKLLYKLFKI